MRPILSASVEEIANFVKESFCLHQPNHERSFRLKTRSSVSSLGREKVEDFDYRQLSNLFEKLMALLSHNLQTADSSEVSLQALILNAWKYYNAYVRFYLLSIFQPLLLHLNELSMRGHNGSTVTRIDDLLLVSFRKVFITEQELEVGIERRLNFWGMLKVKILQEWVVDFYFGCVVKYIIGRYCCIQKTLYNNIIMFC